MQLSLASDGTSPRTARIGPSYAQSNPLISAPSAAQQSRPRWKRSRHPIGIGHERAHRRALGGPRNEFERLVCERSMAASGRSATIDDQAARIRTRPSLIGPKAVVPHAAVVRRVMHQSRNGKRKTSLDPARLIAPRTKVKWGADRLGSRKQKGELEIPL
jgi:hypothetical protein